MHLLETYALTTGIKIDKCFIHEESIELPSRQYITLHAYSPKGNYKQYSFWSKVIYWLKNNNQFNYDIVQIGEEKSSDYDVNKNYLGKTSFNSLAFLIKNSSLHLGYDSFPVHLASYYDINIVALYPHYSNTCGPYFSSPHKIKILEPDYTIYKPSFNTNDPYRLIDSIDPNTVYESVISLLNI